MTKRKILLMVVNVDWFFISHRLGIAKNAIAKGWEVIVIAKDTGKAQEIRDNGMQFINIPLTRSGTNPFKEFFIFLKLFKLYKQIKPTVVHQITMKPVLYGSIIARILQMKAIVNAISGLGYNFTNNNKGIVHYGIKMLFKIGFSQNKSTLIFQNEDDYSELEKAGIVKSHHKIYFMKGVGVNLEKFKYFKEVKKSKVVILFAARLLWNKGIKELKQATDALKEDYKHKISFVLCGIIDEDSKDAVSIEYIREWECKEYVTWLGHQTDMVALFKQCDIVVFPSYREGMPKTLLEACAVGRPIVTTNAHGCKDCVEEGKNGYKVPVKTVNELKEALIKLIECPRDRTQMGMYSRQKAKREFDEQDVFQKHIEIYNSFVQ